jgi:predicted nucleotidyltransferase
VIPEKKIAEFVSKAQAAAGQNLQSVILFGSAASGEFLEDFSDINLLCVLRDTSFAGLTALAPLAAWWQKQKYSPPLVLTQDEIRHSVDVFTIELLDMQRHHRVLFGEDVFTGLEISTVNHRIQVEYELREKVIVLREQLLLAAQDETRMWNLLLGSVAAFTTLFRHALHILDGQDLLSRRAAVKGLSEKISFDPSAILQLLDIRERKMERKQLSVRELFTRYLEAVQKVTDAVDTIFERGNRQS